MNNLDKNSYKSIQRSKKNKLIIGFAVFGFLALIVTMLTQIDPSGRLQAQMERMKLFAKPDVNDTEDEAQIKNAWAIKMENQLGNLKSDTKESFARMSEDFIQQIYKRNEQTMLQIQHGLTDIRKDIKSNQQNLAIESQKTKEAIETLQNQNMQLRSYMYDGLDDMQTKFNTQQPTEQDGVLLPPPPLQSKNPPTPLFKNIDVGDSNKTIPAPVAKIMPQGRLKYEVVTLSNDLKAIEAMQPEEEVLSEEEIKKRNTYRVVTGFTEGYMVTGAYAPLFDGAGGGGGSTEAVPNVPVLIETTGDLLMPNDTIGSIDKCMILANAKGNASARVIDIRADKMTCLLDGGTKIIEGKLKGYIVNEAGTPGLPATMVYRAGEFLSRMVASGLLESLSSAFVNSAAGYNTQAVGSTNFYGAAATGAGNGLNNAFTKLSDFYLQLAEQTLPVLETKPGRFVTLVLNGGDEFEMKDVKLLDTRDIENYMNDFIGDDYGN